MSVTLFSTGPSCNRCQVAKLHLQRKGVEYVEVDLNKDIEQAKELRKQGFNLAPVIRAEKDGATVWSEGYRPDFIDGLAS